MLSCFSEEYPFKVDPTDCKIVSKTKDLAGLSCCPRSGLISPQSYVPASKSGQDWGKYEQNAAVEQFRVEIMEGTN